MDTTTSSCVRGKPSNDRVILIVLVVLVVTLMPIGLVPSRVEAAPPGFLIDQRIPFGDGRDSTIAVVTGDMNGDGTLDIVVGNTDNNDRGGIFFNLAGKLSQSAPDRAFGDVGSVTTSIALGDFNADGTLDVATADQQQQIRIFANDGAANLTPITSFGGPAPGIAAGDVNGDARLDLVAGGSPGQVYYNSAGGSFVLGPELDNDLTAVASADVNSDGSLDIVAGTRYSQIYVYLTAGNGVLQPGILLGTRIEISQQCQVCGITGLALGDLNSDGLLDIAAGNPGAARVYLSATGTPLTFDERVIDPGRNRSSWAVAIGDVDGDGALDLAVGRGYNQQNAVYLNDGAGGLSAGTVLFGTGIDPTRSIALADINGDGALDIVVGNDSSGGSDAQNAVYISDRAGEFARHTTRRFGVDYESGPVRSMSDLAVGDVNGDGLLDLITVSSEFSAAPHVIYLGDGTGTYAASQTSAIDCTLSTLRCYGQSGANTLVVADLDGDRDLDIVTFDDGSQVKLYFNDGSGNYNWPGAVRSFTSEVVGAPTRQIAVGDLNSDGHLDLVFGNRAHLNDGLGNFTGPNAERVFTDSPVLAVAVGDLNGDGHLDIVTGDETRPGKVFFNDGSGNFSWPGAERTYSVALSFIYSLELADVNGDGALDIVSGVFQGRNQVYLNDSRGNFDWQDSQRLFGSPDDRARRVRAVDLNGDAKLDLVVANQESADAIYFNDGQGNFSWAGAERRLTTGITDSEALAVGDLNSDGAPDLAFGKRFGDGTGHTVHLNSQAVSPRQPNELPAIRVQRPVQTREADFLSTAEILTGAQIALSFRLADPEGDPVRAVRAFYSPDGGGRWLPALQPAGGNQTGELAANCPGGCVHSFTWDVYRSGFFGTSDNVLVRLEAYPGHRSAPRATPALNQRPFTTATTFPFRVRGTQVRVLNESGQPYPEAMIYRVAAGESRGGTQFPPRPDGLMPLTTDARGFLQGRGELHAATGSSPGDRLVALAVISATKTYTIYHTSASPTTAGMDLAEVASPGVQTLRIRTGQPLVVFNLEASLEWDARRDPEYLARLREDFVRTSEFLFDWSNGQVALGQVRVYQNHERWDTAHIRIYASNSLRPNAVKGGIVEVGVERPDPDRSDTTFSAGQVRMGATWNRFGDAEGNLGEDWALTLAHELGHFALYLDDNYIGLADDGSLITVEGCRGAMADPFRPDYSEFQPPGVEWDQQCARTLSAWTTRVTGRPTGRADWQSLRLFYENPQAGIRLNEPVTFNAQPGPALLPIALTNVTFPAPAQPVQILTTPFFFTVDLSGARTPVGRSARAFLFQDDRLVDLGKPSSDQILARGARPGDRLCVYDPDLGRAGCRLVSAVDQLVTLTSTADLRPDLRITPVNSTTLDLEVLNLEPGLTVSARLYPTSSVALAPVGLSREGNLYRGRLVSSPDAPAFDGSVHVTITGAPGGNYETVLAYALGGNPGRKWASRAPRGNPGRKWASRAPVISNDGEAILYEPGISFDEGQFFALQATDVLPDPPSYATPLGRGYRLSATPGLTFQGTSLSIAYRGQDVPEIFEGGIALYYWDGTNWQRLTASRRDPVRNEVAAPIPGPGLYALMTSVDISLQGQVWNDVRFPGQGGPLPQVLDSIQGAYSMVYEYVAADADDPWKLHSPSVPQWVNDLSALRYDANYSILPTRNVVLLARPPTGRLAAEPLEALRPQAAPTANLRLPPATFYGVVRPGDGFTPSVGQQVQAYVGDIRCGQARTRLVDGQIVYSIAVESVNPTLPGCGALGRSVTFTVGDRLMNAREGWDSLRLTQRELVPSEPPVERFRVYLPLLRK